MDLNARVDVNCGRKDGRMENRTPISHLAKAGATKIMSTPTSHKRLDNVSETLKQQNVLLLSLIICNRSLLIGLKTILFTENTYIM